MAHDRVVAESLGEPISGRKYNVAVVVGVVSKATASKCSQITSHEGYDC